LVADLRQDLGQPDLAIVVGQVPLPDKYPINAEIAKASQEIPNCGLATNEDTKKCDAYHYDRDSYIKIGQRLAVAYLKLKQAAPGK
jgi:hypothetical protein